MATPRTTAIPAAKPRQLTLEALLRDEGLYQMAVPSTQAVGSLDIQAELMECIAQAIKVCPKDRFAIAAEMSRLSGLDVSKAMIDAWTAPSKEGHRFPLCLLPAFEVACSTIALQELIARKRGTTILVGKQVILAQLGRLEQMEEEMRKEKLKLKRQLGAP